MPTSAPRATTLSETLRAFSDAELVELFRARSDVVTPLPSHLEQLAARATTRSSLARILDRLDQRELAVLEALVIAGPEASFKRVAELLPLSGAELRRVLTRLRGLALIWGDGDALVSPRLLSDLLGPYPAGLGPDSADAPPADRIGALLEEAGPQAREAAELLASSRPPAGRVEHAKREVTVESARTPVERLLARGLLVALDNHTVALPRQVGLFLRGGRLYDKADLAAPDVPGTTRDAALIDRTAAGTAMELVRRVEQVLDDFGQDGLPILRAGGLGVRDLRRIAGRLGVDEATTAFYIEIAYAAELLSATDEVWLPTAAYDRWLDQPTARRWAVLAAAWLGTPRAAALTGTRDEKDKLRSVLSAELSRPAAPELRRLVLAALESAGATSPDQAAVLERVRWTRPRRMTGFVQDFVGWTLTEAAELGASGLGGLASTGRALLAGSDPAEALEPMLPEPVAHVLLQADLTAVAPGPLTRELARSLAEMADPESHGGAAVYRFSQSSVRRALDAGRSAAELHRLLERSSVTPVPQPLSYLIDDVARRHGHLRAGIATAYLRCDDVATLDAVLADKSTAPLGLRRIAPTVVVACTPVRALVDELRALGYEPVAESSDGGLVLETPRMVRALERERGPAPLREPDADLLTAAVRAVRAGDRARASRPEGVAVGQLRRTASTETVEILRDAVAAHRSVWLGYADQHGGISDRIVDPVRIEAGWLTAYDHTSGESRTFALHRITGAAPMEGDAHRTP
ncbi:helicase-associated domain-containing protein [Flindersiella endophytica]